MAKECPIEHKLSYKKSDNIKSANKSTVLSRLIQVISYALLLPVFFAVILLFIPVYIISGFNAIQWFLRTIRNLMNNA